MRQAQARKITNAYLDAPKRSERHLRVVDDAHAPVREAATAVTDAPEARVVEDLRVEAPLVDIPDWAEPFADPRWDDRIGEPAYEERNGRKTVLVTGRPAGTAMPRRESTAVATARVRRQSPTRARLAGRPDRVALWAVGLALLMAAIAGVTGNGSASSEIPVEPTPAPVLER